MKNEREKIILDNSICYKWRDYPTKAVIVFVHGLSGDPVYTWDQFPKLIMGSSLGQNFDVISYGYTSNKILPRSPGLESLVKEFKSFCLSELYQYELTVFVSHSLGSVLVNGMLLELEEMGYATRRFVTHIMITPAFLGGPSWARLSLSKTARQLTSNSKSLKNSMING